MGGTVICPWCDCGWNRDGSKWTLEECLEAHRRFKAEREKALLRRAQEDSQRAYETGDLGAAVGVWDEYAKGADGAYA